MKDALHLKAKLDGLESKHAAELAFSSARIDVREKEKKFLNEELIKVRDLAMRQEHSKARKGVEVDSLNRQLVTVNALHEANVKKAQKMARREMAKKFQGRLAKIEKSLEELKEIREKELDLVEVNSNLKRLDILKKDDAPILDAEVAKLIEWRAGLAGVHEEFEKIEQEVKNELKMSSNLSNSVDSMINPSR